MKFKVKHEVLLFTIINYIVTILVTIDTINIKNRSNETIDCDILSIIGHPQTLVNFAEHAS